MADRPESGRDQLTPEEQAVYDEVRRARAAIEEARTALGPSRDARARALLRTIEDEADALQHLLEWHAERRAVNAAPRAPASSADDDPAE